MSIIVINVIASVMTSENAISLSLSLSHTHIRSTHFFVGHGRCRKRRKVIVRTGIGHFKTCIVSRSHVQRWQRSFPRQSLRLKSQTCIRKVGLSLFAKDVGRHKAGPTLIGIILGVAETVVQQIQRRIVQCSIQYGCRRLPQGSKRRRRRGSCHERVWALLNGQGSLPRRSQLWPFGGMNLGWVDLEALIAGSFGRIVHMQQTVFRVFLPIVHALQSRHCCHWHWHYDCGCETNKRDSVGNDERDGKND